MATKIPDSIIQEFFTVQDTDIEYDKTLDRQRVYLTDTKTGKELPGHAALIVDIYPKYASVYISNPKSQVERHALDFPTISYEADSNFRMKLNLIYVQIQAISQMFSNILTVDIIQPPFYDESYYSEVPW